MYIGDALSMPVHWCYDVARMNQTYGWVKDYMYEPVPPFIFIALAVVWFLLTDQNNRQARRPSQHHHVQLTGTATSPTPKMYSPLYRAKL